MRVLRHVEAGVILHLPEGWAPADTTVEYWRGLLVNGPGGGGELVPLGELFADSDLEPDVPLLAAGDERCAEAPDSWDPEVVGLVAPSVAVQLLPLENAPSSLTRIEAEIRSCLEVDAALMPGWRLVRDVRLFDNEHHLGYTAQVEQDVAHLLLPETYRARLERRWIMRAHDLVAITVSEYPGVAPFREGDLEAVLTGVRVGPPGASVPQSDAAS